MTPNSPKLQSMFIPFALLMLFAVLYQLPPTLDFNEHFYGNAIYWLHGDTLLYDLKFPSFFSPPYGLILLLPLTFFPVKVAEALFLTVSILAIILAIHFWPGHKPNWLIVLALVNLPLLDNILHGQWEGLLVFGLIFGYYALQTKSPWLLGFCLILLAIKPINVALPALLLLVGVRRWSYTEIAQLLFWPLMAIIISFLMVGFDWPFRYLAYRQVIWPGGSWQLLSLWGVAMWQGIFWGWIVLLNVWAFYQLGRCLKTQGLTPLSFSLAIITNILVSSYAPIYHYVLLIPPFLYLGQQTPRIAIVVWFTGFIPLLMIWTPAIIPAQGYLVVLWLAYQWLLVGGKPLPTATPHTPSPS